MNEETMTVTVMYRNGWTVYPLDITISAFCAVCGARRGTPYLHHFCEDGEEFTVHRWDNSCRHLDLYPQVIREHLARKEEKETFFVQSHASEKTRDYDYRKEGEYGMTRTYTYSETVTMQEEVCCNCGVLFAFPQFLQQSYKETGRTFYCPNGHGQVYKESEASRLKEQLEREKKRVQQLETQLVSVQDQLQAANRAAQQQHKRVADGVCPCCHRTFAQLARHMKAKHAEYGKEE